METEYNLDDLLKLIHEGRRDSFKKFINRDSYNYEQMQEICYGFMNDLSWDEIEVYGNVEFDGGQMREIRLGIEHKLSMEQVKFYAKVYFNDMQMMQIRLGFEHGLSYAKVRFYAKSELDYLKMIAIRCWLEDRVYLSVHKEELNTKSEYSIYLVSECGLSLWQVEQKLKNMESIDNLEEEKTLKKTFV